jgi:hypothetical protein
LGIVAFDQFLLKRGRGADVRSRREKVMVLGQEQEIGGQTGSEQNQTDEQ